MPLLFDIQGTQSRAHADRGIARYLRELVAALTRWHPDAVDAFVLNPDLAPPRRIESLTATGRLARSDAVAAPAGGIYHVGSPFEHVGIDRLWPPYARRGRMRLVVTVYDLIPEVFPELYLRDAAVRRAYRARLELLRQADQILAISEATATDVVARLRVPEERVTVVGAGVSDNFRPAEDPEAAFARARAATPTLEPGYVLYTGGLEPRKNVESLLRAYAALPARVRAAHQLVVVCRVLPQERPRLEAELEQLGILGQALFPGYVEDATLVALYQACRLFVFPSLYEGFGLPVAEALACGAPVLASGTSSLLELVSEEARFDPTNGGAITAAIERALADDAFRARLRREDRPSWRDVADRTVEAYRQLRPRYRRPRPRRRLAFVSPLPPQASGVADASYRLLAALREHCEVDAFADGYALGQAGEATAPAGIPVAAATALDRCERARGGYDRVVYCLGNSEYHAGALAALKSRPGIVVAHDLRLSGLYSWAARNRPDLLPRSFHETLQGMYGDRIPPSIGQEGWLDLDDADRHGIFMAKEVLASCEQFLVHSEYAAQLARLDAAPADAAKVGVIPFGVVSPDELPDPSPQTPPLVATFGIASAAKQTEKVIEAFATVAQAHAEARLAVVGSFPDARERVAAERLAEELQISGRTDFTGRLDRTDFYSWMARAAVAVQLRSWSNGETSAAVTDCLAAGIPTIVTGIGFAAELPDRCVVKVPPDIGADALGRRIAGLLEADQRREQLATAGIAYAREHSFERAAKVLYEQTGRSPDAIREAA